MISIVIPIYNQTKELDKCLGSIADQRYKNYEIIIVNDRSTQSMAKVLKKYTKIFGIKLEIMNNQSNHGAPYSRNKGFRRSKGEFILFSDADILMKETMLGEMIDVLRLDKNISYAYSSHYFGHKLFRCFPFDKDRLRQMPYIHTTSLIRKTDFPKTGFDVELKRLQDWDLWLTMLENGKIGKFINQTLFKIQGGGNTMSSWVPSIFYKLFPFLPKVKKYNLAVSIIKSKHSLK